MEDSVEKALDGEPKDVDNISLTWIDFDAHEKERGYFKSSNWFVVHDHKNNNHVEPYEVREIQESGTKKGLPIRQRPQYSVKPFNRRFCGLVSQRLKRLSIKMNLKNRQEKQPLLSTL